MRHVQALSACRQILWRDGRRHDAHFGVDFYFRKLGTAGHAAASFIASLMSLARTSSAPRKMPGKLSRVVTYPSVFAHRSSLKQDSRAR